MHLARQVLRPALRVQQAPLAQVVQQAQLALLELHLPLVALQAQQARLVQQVQLVLQEPLLPLLAPLARLARLVMLAQQALLVFQALPVAFTQLQALHH